MELLIIRHGLPIRLDTVEGPADPPLAPEGTAQAHAVASELHPEGLTALYSSPLLRAVETSAPLSGLSGLPVTVVDGLAEWDRHASSYVPLEQLRTERPDIIAAMAEERWDVLGIDMEAFSSRVVASMDAIAAENPSGRVAVVCHGGVINAYLSVVLGLGRTLFFEPAYTSVSRVRVGRSGRRRLVSINETGHLRRLGAASV